MESIMVEKTWRMIEASHMVSRVGNRKLAWNRRIDSFKT